MPDAATGETATEITAATTTASNKTKVDFSEVQETVSRLAAHAGVTAVLILNQAGDILTQTGQGHVGNPKLLKQTLDAAALYIRSIPSDYNGGESSSPSDKSSSFEDLSFVRIRSQREEILVAPKNQYVLVVLQDPTIAAL